MTLEEVQVTLLLMGFVKSAHQLIYKRNEEQIKLAPPSGGYPGFHYQSPAYPYGRKSSSYALGIKFLRQINGT